jgi:ubiquinone/menaquinone biosynthesis C-methylase UbiE
MRNLQDVKEYWDRRPCNIRHSPKPIGSRGYFDEVESRKYFVEPHIPGFAHFPRWHGKDVLEIGCGIGTDSLNFARNGANLTIVELSSESLAITKKRLDLDHVGANLIHGNAEELDLSVDQ